MMHKTNNEEKETIHSGQFMVSHFEAEEQDDEDDLAVPVPEDPVLETTVVPVKQFNEGLRNVLKKRNSQQQLEIDTSLSKLFQCMSLAYRQKLTSPKWNRFRGIRLRWKDKIRLNNVIWRCWHLQFIKKANTLICQFASPLEVDTHNKPEAVVLEGKYWKRKLAACTAEYKKWRMFYRNHFCGHSPKDASEMLTDVELLMLDSQNAEDNMHMMVDEDYMGLMSDTLFSTISNQPFVFPDSREIAEAGLADFIQPSLGPLQPNLDDYMDTLEPFQDFISCKLPTVPEEQSQESIYKPLSWSYPDLGSTTPNSNLQVTTNQNSRIVDPYQLVQRGQSLTVTDRPLQSDLPTDVQTQSPPHYQNTVLSQQQQTCVDQFTIDQQTQPAYHTSVISKNKQLDTRTVNTQIEILPDQQRKSISITYQSSDDPNVQKNASSNENLQAARQVQNRSQQMKTIVQAGVQNENDYKLEQNSLQLQEFNFTPSATANFKYTSQVSNMPCLYSHFNTSCPSPSEEEIIGKRSSQTFGEKQRSKSNTREPIKKPPLVSAVSDPSLVSTSNVILNKSLTSNSESSKNVNQSQTVTSLKMPHQIKKEENTSTSLLPQPPPTTLILTSVNISAVQDSSTDLTLLNSYSNSNSPILDTNSQSINSPTSSHSSLGSPNRDSPKDNRSRTCHLQSEQKRRISIKHGFDSLYSLIPHLNQNPNTKVSKAAMLQKGAEYIRQLKIEREQLKEENDILKQQIESLNSSISNCQSLLPATGAPVSRRTDSKMQEMFDEYVKTRTMENWKFWIFSLLFRPLLVSFNNLVSTSSLDDLYRTTLLWIEQHCTLAELRPVVLNSLRYLSTKTEILSEPEKLPEEIRHEVLTSSQKKNK